jgi:arylsulfatase A-like enzyme
MLGLAHRGWRLRDYGQHIVHALHGAGYTSALAGVQHIASPPFAEKEEIGYEEILLPAVHRAADVAPVAADYVRRSHERPFFLTVGFFETHRRFVQPDGRDDPRYALPPLPVPDTPETRADMAAFKATARLYDEAVGEVAQAVDAAGLSDSTLIIATTDHGLPFPRMKCHLADQGMGVMLIMKGPGTFSGGKVVDAMVSQIDIFPTICGLLGIHRPPWLQGLSILPLLEGKARCIHDEIFSEVTYHAAYEPMRAVRTNRWKYIRRWGGRNRPVLPNSDDGPSKTLWLENGWAGQSLPEEELYDHIFDPAEVRNLASDPGRSEILKDLRQRLETWMETTDDPLLKGPVELPPGGITNDPGDISAKDPLIVQKREGE